MYLKCVYIFYNMCLYCIDYNFIIELINLIIIFCLFIGLPNKVTLIVQQITMEVPSNVNGNGMRTGMAMLFISKPHGKFLSFTLGSAICYDVRGCGGKKIILSDSVPALMVEATSAVVWMTENSLSHA